MRPVKLEQGVWWDVQWNPWIGCTPVGAACDHCWAKREEDGRFHHLGRSIPNRQKLGFTFMGQALRNPKLRFNNGPVEQSTKEMLKPTHWRRPRVIGVCMRSDLFHEDIPFERIDRAFSGMAEAPQHTFIIPTKRTARAADFFAWYHARHPDCPPIVKWIPNLWLLASVWDQASADSLIPPLFKCPVAVRGISYEPALGPVNLRLGDNMGPGEDSGVGCVPCDEGGQRHQHYVGEQCFRGLDWVIAGGESGKEARPSHPDWFRQVRDQCHEAGAPFMFKQWGEWGPAGVTRAHWPNADPGIPIHEWPDGAMSDRVGKKTAGRLLDGEQHDGWPGKES